LNVNQKSFHAQVTNANFQAAQTLADINRWASDNTKGRIPTILNEISPDKIMFLLNAVYFKGEWTVKFDKNNTTDQDFNTPSGKKKHPLMQRTGYMVFQRAANYEAVKLPFGNSQRINLFVLLPNQDVSIDDFVAGLDESAFAKLARSGYESEGTLYLPR